MEGRYLTIEKLNLFLKGINKDYVFISNDNFAFETMKYNPDILRIVEYYQNKENYLLFTRNIYIVYITCWFTYSFFT